jgi:hypothetical protein
MEIKAPEVILKRKRMLQESVDSLFDNTLVKASAVKPRIKQTIKKILSDDSLKVNKDVSVKKICLKACGLCSFQNGSRPFHCHKPKRPKTLLRLPRK